MSLRINDVAPNFKAKTTQGPIDFHEWIGYMAKIEPEFTKRNVKLIGLSIGRTVSRVK